jgi:N-acyl-D-amino-acid deacylase
MDIIVRGGLVVDGTGSEGFPADIGISKGKMKILPPGSFAARASRVIDARGKVVAPGFINAHCHTDPLIADAPSMSGELLQGVTTDLVGHCGIGLFPVRPDRQRLAQDYLEMFFSGFGSIPTWSTAGEFLKFCDEAKPGVNVGAFLPHGMTRLDAMGMDNRRADDADLDRMSDSVREAIGAGCFGMSTGLIYAPGTYSDEAEIEALCEVLVETGGAYTTHLRGEGGTLEEALSEALRIHRRTGVPLCVSHLKALGRENWSKNPWVVETVASEGSDGTVVCDAYPYTSASTSITTLLPPWVLSGGREKMLQRCADVALRDRILQEMEGGLPGWDSMVRGASWEGIILCSTLAGRYRQFEGRTLSSIAKAVGASALDTYMSVVIEGEGRGTIAPLLMSSDGVDGVLRMRSCAIGSDGIAAKGGKPHPRLTSTFPRVLGHYVRERKVLKLEDAVRKMTSLPADFYGIPLRGRLADGYWADVTVFDPSTIHDVADFSDPWAKPIGIDWVIVNGNVAVEEGEVTGTRAGVALRAGQ